MLNLNTNQLFDALFETVYMTLVSTLFIFIFGVALGLYLYLTDEGRLLSNKRLYTIISSIVDLLRSIPFVILIILLVPFTKLVVGTILGMNAALPALITGGTAFYARMVELSLREVDKGTIEAVIAMGASKKDLIFKVFIPEALPGIISGITVTGVSIVSYSAMAGIIGTGGLGNYAYLYGFQRNNYQIVFIATLFILFVVLIIQKTGNTVSKKIDKR